MPGAGTNRPYRWLARYYDQFFTFHLSWFEAARQRVLGPILPRLDSACDLACGTGTTAVLLARQGIRMFAVDLSPVMCRLALMAKAVARALRPGGYFYFGVNQPPCVREDLVWSLVVRVTRRGGRDARRL